MELAPLPMIATRLPARSRSLGHWAVWNFGPSKGWSVSSAPSGVRTVTAQPRAASSYAADTTSVPKRIVGRRPNESATCSRYECNSSRSAKYIDQS
jgi:hypothetical protein